MDVFDAGALIALVRGAAGGATVAGSMPGARMPSVDYSESLSALGRAGLPIEMCEVIVDALQVEILPFTESQVRVAALLFAVSAQLGLSPGDRACFAAAIDLGERAITDDRVWADRDTSVEVFVVR